MILIDAIYINNGGGKVLLDYLIQELEKTDLEIFYLFDDRIKEFYQIKTTNHVIYQDSSIKKRLDFYKLYRNTFDKVFILGNIPPLCKIKATVYCYFHNAIYLNVPSDFGVKEKLLYILKIFIIKLTKKNVDKWLVQTNFIAELLASKFNIKIENIDILPFFPPLVFNKTIERKKNTFLYVSNAQANKNHKRLISAYSNIFKEYPDSELLVTVGKEYPKVLDLITNVKKDNVSISNLGFLKREMLPSIYQQTEYLIFPSLSESFGLGIVEAISMGCKVLVADLPYAYSVCKPSLFFNPLDVKSIENVFREAIKGDIPISKSLVNDEIIKLINLLKT